MTGSSKHEKHSGLSMSAIKEMMHFMDHREHKTDFEHPGCGGTFYEKADNVRLHGKFEPRYYTTDGVFTWVFGLLITRTYFGFV